MVYHNCDSCEALYINGIFCHEQGCPRKEPGWYGHPGDEDDDFDENDLCEPEWPGEDDFDYFGPPWFEQEGETE